MGAKVAEEWAGCPAALAPRVGKGEAAKRVVIRVAATPVEPMAVELPVVGLAAVERARVEAVARAVGVRVVQRVAIDRPPAARVSAAATAATVGAWAPATVVWMVAATAVAARVGFWEVVEAEVVGTAVAMGVGSVEGALAIGWTRTKFDTLRNRHCALQTQVKCPSRNIDPKGVACCLI